MGVCVLVRCCLDSYILACFLAQIPPMVHDPQVKVTHCAAREIAQDLCALYNIGQGLIDIVVPVQDRILPLYWSFLLDAHIPTMCGNMLQQIVISAQRGE